MLENFIERKNFDEMELIDIIINTETIFSYLNKQQPTLEVIPNENLILYSNSRKNICIFNSDCNNGVC